MKLKTVTKEEADKLLAIPLRLESGDGRKFAIIEWSPSINADGVVKANMEVMIFSNESEVPDVETLNIQVQEPEKDPYMQTK